MKLLLHGAVLNHQLLVLVGDSIELERVDGLRGILRRHLRDFCDQSFLPVHIVGKLVRDCLQLLLKGRDLRSKMVGKLSLSYQGCL